VPSKGVNERVMKQRINLFIILFLFWLLLNLNIEISTLLTGLIVAFFVTIFSFDILLDKKGFHFKGIPIHRLIFYFFRLFIEIFKSAWFFTLNLFKKTYEPMIFRINLEHLDSVKVAIVANSITLTPGTISVEMINNWIYVMVLADPQSTYEELERPIRESFERLLLDKEDRT
jgi:multicomponent Na+:H+ antiporter subunit E